MEEINPEDILNFWKKGKTLYASLFVYTDESLREKFDRSNKEFENQSNAISKEHSHGAPSMEEGLKAIQNTIYKHQGIRGATNELKWNLLNKLLSEKLIGLGFESPIKSSGTPQIIPIYIWPQIIFDIDWNESSFLNNGIEFLNIRLIEIAEFKKQKNSGNQIKKIKKPPVIKVKVKKVGRPSIRDLIIEAYEYLIKRSRIDFAKPLKSHTELIQQTVRILHPEKTDNIGMQHESIRRTITERFKADKKNL